MKTITFITGNQHKLKEILNIIGDQSQKFNVIN